ncbi:MAG: glycosyltransferase family 9 protein, partial [Alphaproteobacteria bacterium]|nr:glycosyltransferase family 9 protein [Alphaproteobacteria bacterium]
EGIKIAISWHGGETAFDKRQRAVPLSAFEPLSKLKDISLVSVQKGEGTQQLEQVSFPVQEFTLDLDEGESAFLDTAAIIDQSALVVTVDNSVAHLAAALGRPVWMILPEGQPDWRWGADGRDSLWYPTLEIFTKEPNESYDDLLTRLARRLEMMQSGVDPDELDKSLQVDE